MNADEQAQYRFDFEELYYKAVAMAIKFEATINPNIAEVRVSSVQGTNRSGENALNYFFKRS